MPTSDDKPKKSRTQLIIEAIERGDSPDSSTSRQFATGRQLDIQVGLSIRERKALLDRAIQADQNKRSDQSIAIQAELKWLDSLKIVSTRLAELRAKYEEAVPPSPHKADDIYTKLKVEVEALVPTQKDWKDATSVWYGKRGEALLRVDNGIARVRTLLTTPRATAARFKILELLTATADLYNAINKWAAKKLGGTREDFEQQARDLENRRLQTPKAKQYYKNLRELGALNAAYVLLLDPDSKTKTVQAARKEEMFQLFETLDFDSPSDQLGNIGKAASAGKGAYEAVKKAVTESATTVSTHIALELKTAALEQAVKALDVLGVTDAVSALWNAYKAYDYAKKKQNLENQACTRLDDSMVLRMIDTLQGQIQIKCEQSAEAAIVYGAAAATKAASQGLGAPVAEALKAMHKLTTIIEQIAATAYERGELLAIKAIDRTRDPEVFVDHVLSNVTLTCYYIRLAAPQNLLRPLSYKLFAMDDGVTFKKVHDTKEMTEALADVLELKECADEILMGWNTQIKNLHAKAREDTPLDGILLIYGEIDPGKLKALSNYFSRQSRHLEAAFDRKKDEIVAAFEAKVRGTTRSSTGKVSAAA